MGVAEAVQRAAGMVLNKKAVDEWPRRAVALRDMCRAVFETDGRISGLSREDFSRCRGKLLFRGVNYFKYIRENLNGQWVGTGFLSDGNYYAGETSRSEAIEEYGFGDPPGWGWAMPYKLTPKASLIEAGTVKSLSLCRFVYAVRQQYHVDRRCLEIFFQETNDDAFRAVLLGYDGIVDSGSDHYVIFNNKALVYRTDCTPWARGIEQFPHELLTTEQSEDNTRPQLVHQDQTESSSAQLMLELSKLQSEGMDKNSGIGLKYANAAHEVRQELREMRS